MNNLHLAIIKNKNFYDLVNELDLDLDCTFFEDNNFFLKNKSNTKLTVRIIFPENLTLTYNNKFFMENVPTLFLLKDKNFLVNNNLTPLSFHVVLDVPIDLFFFKEIINILKMKYIFFEKSKILINDYELDSNQRILSKNNKAIKLTEKELSLILGLKNKNGVSKSELLKSIWNYSSKVETHTFETNLYRLRKKIEKKFNDKNFIYEKGSFYYLS
jgi:hypothetical protein